MPSVFISYVRENSTIVDRLARTLTAYRINVWLDRNNIKPGMRWKRAIREAISEGDFFIGCFSAESKNRFKTYMNEELTLAVDELRLRPHDRTWFIPVLLSETSIPDRDIGGGETLGAFQGVDLYRDWDEGIKRIVSVIRPNFVDEPQVCIPRLSDRDWDTLLHRVRQGRCTPFLGPATHHGIVPSDSSIARDWAAEFNYPEGEPLDLASVAQFLAQLESVFPNDLIREKLAGLLPNFSDPNEPHTVLSALSCPIYITTSYDDFMVRALRQRGKMPSREFFRWNEQLRKVPSVFDNFDFKPTLERPLVFHLYGHTEVPESMVITQDDYREFISNTPRDLSLPRIIEAALAYTLPLFLGYDPADLKFRNLIQMVNPYLKINVHRPAGGFQLTPSKIPKYLEHQFARVTGGSRVEAFTEFIRELRRRWEELSRGF